MISDPLAELRGAAGSIKRIKQKFGQIDKILIRAGMFVSHSISQK